ncbi:MAG TPA: Xaa-Pro peptidase family protein [Methylomirabilota bacterium]
MYPHQAERLTAALEGEGLDALVASSPANVAYVTGFWSLARAVQPATEIYAVAARAGAALVVPTIDALAVIDGDAQADHVVCHGRFSYDYGPASPPPGASAGPATVETAAGGERARRLRAVAASSAATAEDALAAGLAALGLRAGRIGLDDAALPAARVAALGQRLAGHTLVSASEAFATARLVKSPYEIDCLQQALHLTEESLDAVLGLLRPGVTEREAATAFEHEATRRGVAPYRTIVAFGAGSAVPAPWPTERALRSGDFVRFDLGCVAKGYRSNVARMAVMGEPSARQQAVFDALHAGMEALLDALRPGVTGSQLFDTGVAAVRKAGLPGFERHHMGHAIGLEATEAPWLAPGGGALEMGMVVCPETPYYAAGEAGLTVTETALVTGTGAHPLNRSHRGLVVLD